MRPPNPWWFLGGTLAYNLFCHRRGWPTLCSKGRERIPAATFVVGWCFLSGWLIPHYIDGFKIDLENLND